MLVRRPAVVAGFGLSIAAAMSQGATVSAAPAARTSSIAPASSVASAAARRPLRVLFAQRLGSTDRFSSGLRSWIAGPPSVRGETGRDARASLRAATPVLGSNVDANDPGLDLVTGQSESSVAAEHRGSTSLVLAAWNDISGTIGNPTTRKGSATGVGLSLDGGRHVSDLVGLPNGDADQQWMGDPSVVSLGDGRHFVVSSLYYPSSRACERRGRPAYATIALSVVTVGATARDVSFTPPIVLAKPGNACGVDADKPPRNLAVLDKDWLAYDPTSRTLALSYSRFFVPPPTVCDPGGDCAPAPGTHTGTGQVEVLRARVPRDPSTLRAASFGKPVVLWPEEPACPGRTVSSEKRRCGAVDTGAYLALAPGGDAYVAWERNVNSNLTNGDAHVYLHAALLRSRAAHPALGGTQHPVVLTAAQPRMSRSGGVRSLDAVPIAGYSRGSGQDFPRVAVDRHGRRVVFVWNDANLHPLGDIWLRSTPYGLSRLGPSVRVNDDESWALHFMPAVSVRADGTVCTSWYDRRAGGADSTRTDYVADCRTSLLRNSPDFAVSTGPTDWAGTSSFMDPNFGDYSDSASDGTRTYFTWADGRLGVPQPFVDSRG